MVRALLSTSVALLAAATVAHAQATYYGPSELRVYDDAIGTLSGFTRCEPGQIDRDCAVDFVTLRDRTLFVTLSPEFFGNVALTVHEDATDFAVLPSGRTDVADSLLVAAPDGLFLATLPELEESFRLDRIAFDRELLRLRVADFDGDGDLELFALRVGGRVDVSDPSSGAFVAAFEVPVDSDDFVVLRFEPACALAQVAARHPDGVEVRAVDRATPLLVIEDEPDLSLLARTRSVDGRDGLVRVIQRQLPDEPYAHQWLSVHWSDRSEPPIDLGWTECSSLVPVDIERDGDDDLMVGVHWSYDALLLVNESRAGANDDATFSASFCSYIIAPLGLSGPATDNNAMPAFGDIDGDGDLDLFMNLEAIDGYMTMKSPIAGNEAELALMPAASTFRQLDDGSWLLELSLMAPQRLDPRCDSLEIAMWRQPALDELITPGTVERRIVPMPAFDATGHAQLDFAFAEGGWMAEISHFVVRAVATEDRAIVGAVSAANFAFTTDEATRTELCRRMGETEWTEVIIDGATSAGGKGPRLDACGGTLGGGIICFPSLFPFGGRRP